MNKTWKAVLGIILIFLFGCFSGAVSTSIFVHHKMVAFLHRPGVVMTAEMEKRLTTNLALDDNQKQQVHGYFLENFQQRKELQKQIQPQMQMLNRQTFQQVTAILHPEQVERFHQNVEQFRKRAKAFASAQDAENPSSHLVHPSGPATNPGAGQPPAQ
jgi:hypothetical protein